MSFALIRPEVVTDAVLVSSSVSESVSPWSAATSYSLGGFARGLGEDAYKLFKSLQNANLNHPLTDGAWWVEQDNSTNRWAMFDQSPQSQTRAADQIAVRLQLAGRATAFYFENVEAQTVRVTQTDAVDGIIFDETIAMVSTAGITDAWEYCFEPVERVSDLLGFKLRPYVGSIIDIVISNPGSEAACGVCVVGQARELGKTQWGAGVGIQDYTVKSTDEFGKATVVKRGFAKRMDCSILVPKHKVDPNQTLLAGLRATPIVYVADPRYASTAVYGFFKEFNTVIQYPTLSLCAMSVEGLAA